MSNVTDEILAKAKALRHAREKDVEFETSWGQVRCHDGSRVWFPRLFGDAFAAQAKTRPFVTLSESARQLETVELCDAVEMLAAQNKLLREAMLYRDNTLSHMDSLENADSLEQAFRAKWGKS